MNEIKNKKIKECMQKIKSYTIPKTEIINAIYEVECYIEELEEKVVEEI